jgi:CBS domain-containing protein
MDMNEEGPMNVEKIVRKDVVPLRTEEAIGEAWRQMRDQRLDALPVTDTTGHVVGLLTEHGLLARLAPRRAPRWWTIVSGAMDRLAADYVKAVGVTVGEIMMDVPPTTAPDASIQEAAVLMRRHKVDALPVVADDNTCIGIVTRIDVLDNLAWPVQTLPVTIGDTELERSMRQSIAREAWATRHPITVEALHGIIRLTGVVASPVERSALLTMARSLAGCAGVEDRLAVLSRRGRHHRAPTVI